MLRLRRLKQRLGLAFYPLLGIFSGFYALDLSNKEDRMCMTKLIEQNIRNEYHRRLAGKWDISQNGNWSCFRNEYHITYPDMTISPKYFVPIPQNGKLEFDFVNIARPNPRTNKPLSDDRVIDVSVVLLAVVCIDMRIDNSYTCKYLINLNCIFKPFLCFCGQVLLVARLLRDDNVELAYKKLKDYSIAGRKAFLSNGNPYYRADLGRALNRGEYLHQMYQNITNRKKSLQRVAKKEALKAVAIAKSTKEASGNFLISNLFI